MVADLCRGIRILIPRVDKVRYRSAIVKVLPLFCTNKQILPKIIYKLGQYSDMVLL